MSLPLTMVFGMFLLQMHYIDNIEKLSFSELVSSSFIGELQKCVCCLLLDSGAVHDFERNFDDCKFERARFSVELERLKIYFT